MQNLIIFDVVVVMFSGPVDFAHWDLSWVHAIQELACICEAIMITMPGIFEHEFDAATFAEISERWDARRASTASSSIRVTPPTSFNPKDDDFRIIRTAMNAAVGFDNEYIGPEEGGEVDAADGGSSGGAVEGNESD